MATRLIKLEDGTLVEAEIPDDQAETISSSTIKKVESTFDKVEPILANISRPIAKAWKKIDRDMKVEQAEVEVAFNFEGQGNLYITQAKAGANLKVKLVLKPRDPEDD